MLLPNMQGMQRIAMGFTTSKRWRLADIAVSLFVLIALIAGSQASLAYGLDSEIGRASCRERV